jgi:TorA maturation chaperone TorD
VFQQGEVMADIAAFYRAHGLQLGGMIRQRPDGIGPQLEFMGFLALKQAHALTTGTLDLADICVDTQRSFLADHLGSWGPEYGRRMAAVADHDFYRAVGSFLAMWLDADMERLGVVAVGVGDGSDTAARPIAVPGVGWPNSEDGCGVEGDEAWP